MWQNKSLKSRYVVKNKQKYIGDHTSVTARSSWERAAFIWCENNPNVIRWASENVEIPYVNPVDKKTHKYIMDLMIWWADGSISIIEIKPKYQTKPPTGTRRTKKYIQEAFEYVKNESKWKSARRLAQARGWKFEIWTEEVLKGKGVKII